MNYTTTTTKTIKSQTKNIHISFCGKQKREKKTKMYIKKNNGLYEKKVSLFFTLSN